MLTHTRPLLSKTDGQKHEPLPAAPDTADFRKRTWPKLQLEAQGHCLAFYRLSPGNYGIQREGHSGCWRLCCVCPSRERGWNGREPSPSDEREATSPGLTPGSPQSHAHPPPRASQAPTPHLTLAPAPPSSACSPPHLPTQGSLAALTRGQVYLLGFLPGCSSRSPCHCHAATGPQKMGLRNRVERHWDTHLPGIATCWVGAGLLWAELGRA